MTIEELIKELQKWPKNFKVGVIPPGEIRNPNIKSVRIVGDMNDPEGLWLITDD